MPFQSPTPVTRLGPLSTPRAHGRAHWLIIGSLVVISALWIGADGVRNNQGQDTTLVSGSIASAKNAEADARAAASVSVEVLRVTAPRVVTPTFTFDKPVTDLALAAPEAPAQHWTDSGS